MLKSAHIPAEQTGSCRLSFLHHPCDKVLVDGPVVRVYHLKTLLIAQPLFGQQVAVKVDGVLLLYVEFQHIVFADVEGVLHNGRYLLCLPHTFSDAEDADAVDADGSEKDNQHHKQEHHIDGVLCRDGHS